MQSELIQAYDDCEFHLIYQKVHNFCAVDMGGFYLDIIKDRQYTCRTDSVARRSAQTAMYHIVEALVRWLAPILSFTAEEIWRHIPGEHGESVLLETWYELPALGDDAGMGLAYWQHVLKVREHVAKELEKLRMAGGIGSSLDAEVDLYCGPELHELLYRLEDELRFVLITSYARIHPLVQRPADAVATELDELAVKVSASEYAKCVRCWHHREDVGANPEHPELCGRCVDNVAGAGEQRQYA